MNSKFIITLFGLLLVVALSNAVPFLGFGGYGGYGGYPGGYGGYGGYPGGYGGYGGKRLRKRLKNVQ